jgi:hypothetical protein
MSDPFPHSLTEGKWETIRGGHELVFMGGDRMLDWRPDTGDYRLWAYDQNPSQGADPLPGRAICEGRWTTIGRGHELVYLFHDRLLDWEPATGKFRVWQFDRNKQGGDPFPTTTCEGQWSSIRGAHHFIYLDGDLLLDWQPASGDYKVWQVDRNNTSDPFPGSAVVSGNWSTIRSGHELVYLSNNRMLDWVPQSGGFKVWNVDRSGKGGDLLPGSAVMEGEWRTIRGQRKLLRVNEKQVLEWESSSGTYRVWQVDV